MSPPHTITFVRYYYSNNGSSWLVQQRLQKLPSRTWTIGETGATGDFGRMILEQLLDQFKWPPNQLVAIFRDSNRELAMKWKARGLLVREADFNDVMSPAVKAAHPNRMRLVDAYSGVNRLMIINKCNIAFELVPFARERDQRRCGCRRAEHCIHVDPHTSSKESASHSTSSRGSAGRAAAEEMRTQLYDTRQQRLVR